MYQGEDCKPIRNRVANNCAGRHEHQEVRVLDKLPLAAGHEDFKRFERPPIQHFPNCFRVHGFAFQKGQILCVIPKPIIPRPPIGLTEGTMTFLPARRRRSTQ
jgi:hypothetical protein